jgi:DNA-directed RNA polymerase subunit RPC12/RpoP
MIEFRCPACGQKTTIQPESLSVGMEIVCRECDSILAVEKVEPLVLAEIDLDDSD